MRELPVKPALEELYLTAFEVEGFPHADLLLSMEELDDVLSENNLWLRK